MHKVLHEENWRAHPQLMDAPAACQIFGELVKSAGVQAVLYSSVKTGRDCLAVFPENFEDSASSVELLEYPENMLHKSLNAGTYKKFW